MKILKWHRNNSVSALGIFSNLLIITSVNKSRGILSDGADNKKSFKLPSRAVS